METVTVDLDVLESATPTLVTLFFFFFTKVSHVILQQQFTHHAALGDAAWRPDNYSTASQLSQRCVSAAGGVGGS